jgi:uncharacterized protein
MKIQIGSLSEGLHEYQFTTPVEEAGLGEPFDGQVNVSVSLEKTGNQIVLRGLVKAGGEFTCDRCAGSFPLAVDAAYRMYYVTEGGQFEGIDPAELQVVTPGAGSIDITEDVRQTAMLAIPLKLLCSETCRGLCPKCGTNLNVQSCSCTREEGDTRWEPLRSLRGSK